MAHEPRHLMPMTAEDIRNVNLNRSAVGRRGYREHDVDLLLRRLANDAERREVEIHELQVENQRIKAALKEWQSRQPPMQGLGADNAEAIRLLERAQNDADTIVAQAQDYSRRVLEHARRQAEEIYRSARSAIDTRPT